MTDAFERPAARRRARPAADDSVDPMDTGATVSRRPAVTSPLPSNSPAAPAAPSSQANWPAAAEPSTHPFPPVAVRAPSGAYVTLNVRVAPDVDDLISRVMSETGMTKRAAVERALRHTYG